MLSNLYLSFHRQQQTGGCHHIWQRAEQAWVRTMASTGGTDTRERSRLEEGKRLLLEAYPKEDDLGPQPPPPPPPRPTTPRLPRPLLNGVLANLQEVLLGTKLFLLFPTIPLAIAASYFHFPSTWVFALSLLGLTPLAERISFLTEQIAHYTGSTVGGLLNATCGNATELIIALFALRHGKIEVIKCSLVGSVLSSLLLVMGASLFFGGLANLAKSPPQKEQHYDRKQASACLSVLLLGVLCHMLPLMFRSTAAAGFGEQAKLPTLQLSRTCSIFMLLAYVAYLVFQLKTHSQLFESQQEEGSGTGRDDVASDDQPEVGFYSALTWLAGMTTVVALLSEYVVATIEDASASWGMSVSFISIILLPLVGNAAEIAGAIIFALKNKLDISMGVSLGSATQISMFVVPLSVTVGWMMGVHMDLDFKLLETGSLLASVLITTFTLQDGTSHYLKGLILLLCYSAIGACFFYLRAPKGFNRRERELSSFS